MEEDFKDEKVSAGGDPEGRPAGGGKSLSWTQLFLCDYEMQVGPVSEACRRRLEEEEGGRRRWWLLWFWWDFLFCYFVVGPLLVAFWRGAWDIAGISWNKVFGVTNCSRLYYSSASST